MARKKKSPGKEPNHERWLVSYADFITLLFAVFVTLYAMSQTDKKKVEEVIASMSASFGFTSTPASKPSVIEMGAMNIIPNMQKSAVPKRGRSQGRMEDFKATKASIEAYLMKAGAQDKVGVSIDQRGLVVSLKEAGFFDSGSAAIKSSSLPLLNDVVGALASYSNRVRVEGHTDNVPIRSAAYPSNWELSTARATNVLQYLMKQDFEADQLCAAGYGEYHPVADNNSEEGRRKNRRVDIVLLSPESERSEPPALPAATLPAQTGSPVAPPASVTP